MLQGNLTLQLDALVWMNSKSQLIKNFIKLKVLLNEIKRIVFMEMDKLWEKKMK